MQVGGAVEYHAMIVVNRHKILYMYIFIFKFLYSVYVDQ